MVVLRDREHGHFALAVAGGDDGDFLKKRQTLFQDAANFTELLKSDCQLTAVINRDLAFAVVAQTGGFQDGGEVRSGSLLEVLVGFDQQMRSNGGAGRFDERLFIESVLRDADSVCCRTCFRTFRS